LDEETFEAEDEEDGRRFVDVIDVGVGDMGNFWRRK
jgi:hypothetical protein